MHQEYADAKTTSTAEMTMPTGLPDDELIDVPAANLRPGELTRAFIVQAEHAKKLRDETVSEQSSLTALQRRHEEEDDEKQEVARRETALLEKLREQELEIHEEAERLDARTIKLDDGRRAYVDRDGYRDAEGTELTGADRAQAELHHLEQPNAATWQEHEQIEREKAATRQLRQKVEAISDESPDAGRQLAGYEREFQNSVARRESQVQKAPDYGSGDYMAAFGLSGVFDQARAASSPRSTPGVALQSPVSRDPQPAALTF